MKSIAKNLREAAVNAYFKLPDEIRGSAVSQRGYENIMLEVGKYL